MLGELWSDLRYRCRALFRRGAVEAELDQELRFHLERETEKYVREGIPRDEAVRRARVAFGSVDVVKEESRDGRGLALLEHVGQDLRYALRSLRRSPAFTLGVTLTLAFGIGANAAMFGIVDRLLFRAPPLLRESDTVHRVYLNWTYRGDRSAEGTYQYTRYLDLRRLTHSFSDWAAFSNRTLPVGTGPDARELTVGTVSASFFDFFDAQPVLGRFFTAAEDSIPVGATVAVLGYGYWQTHLGGRTDVLGQPIMIETTNYTIIGVAPREFQGLPDQSVPAVYIPITTYAGTFMNGRRVPGYYTTYNWGWLSAIARRRPGVTLEQANADLSQAFTASWTQEVALDPRTPSLASARPAAVAAPVQSERGPRQGKVSRVATWIWGVAAVVLLIACANVANLLLARALFRRRETALRLALGVSRARLAGQLLIESLVLAVLGGGAGLLLAQWGGAVLGRLFLPEYQAGVTLADGRTLLCVLLAVLTAGCLIGLAPVLQSRRADLAEDLKAGSREVGHRRSRMRTALLLLQATLSVVLLIGAGLFVRSLAEVRGLRLGYDVDPVLYIQLNTRGGGLDQAGQIQFRRTMLETARTLPGVTSAALGITVPFWDTWGDDLFVPGIDSVDRLGNFTLQAGTPEYFKTIGTRILRGRGFTAEDRAQAPRVMVVSEAMAATLWPGENPLGKCVRVGADTMPCSTVVGVAENIRQRSLREDPGLNYYMPLEQYHPDAAALFLRVAGEADKVKESLRRQLQPLMPGDGYVLVNSMRDIVGPQVRSWELGATMFLIFGALALVLAAIGLYSVIAYDVAQRTRELGIRIALGAATEDVVGLVTRDGLRFVLTGAVLGGAIALGAGRWIAPLLYAVTPGDPLVYGVVAGVLLLVAAIASLVPAWRATRVNPSLTLRSE